MLRFLSLLCVCFAFPNYLYFPGDHFSAKPKDMRGDVDQGSSRWSTQPEGKPFPAHHPFEDGEDEQRTVW